MEKGKYILLAYICCMIILIGTISLLFYLYPPGYGFEPPTPCAFKMNQTKIDNDYLLTIIAITPYQINPKGFEWWLVNQSGFRLYNNHFPYLSGESASTTDDNITVTWFDNDKNKKLSRNDTIKIESPSDNLFGFKFNILKPIDENSFDTVSKIELL